MLPGVPGGSKTGLSPLQEYLLQGSIQDPHVDVFLHRLSGLSDTVTPGPQCFNDHEIVFQISNRGSPTCQPLVLRVRRSLEQPDYPWHVRYVGQPEVGPKSTHTLVRSCIDVGTSDNIVQFLQEMGFKMDHEYIAKGYLFRKGRMKITVFKIFRLLQPGNAETMEPISGSHLVELSVLATHGQEQIQEVMKNFADQLKPLVQLEKIDHQRTLAAPRTF